MSNTKNVVNPNMTMKEIFGKKEEKKNRRIQKALIETPAWKQILPHPKAGLYFFISSSVLLLSAVIYSPQVLLGFFLTSLFLVSLLFWSSNEHVLAQGSTPIKVVEEESEQTNIYDKLYLYSKEKWEGHTPLTPFPEIKPLSSPFHSGENVSDHPFWFNLLLNKVLSEHFTSPEWIEKMERKVNKKIWMTRSKFPNFIGKVWFHDLNLGGKFDVSHIQVIQPKEGFEMAGIFKLRYVPDLSKCISFRIFAEFVINFPVPQFAVIPVGITATIELLEGSLLVEVPKHRDPVCRATFLSAPNLRIHFGNEIADLKFLNNIKKVSEFIESYIRKFVNKELVGLKNGMAFHLPVEGVRKIQIKTWSGHLKSLEKQAKPELPKKNPPSLPKRPETVPPDPASKKIEKPLPTPYTLKPEFTKMVEEMKVEKRGIPSTEKRHHLHTYHNAFEGREMVDWLLLNKYASSREEAAEIARQLLERKVFGPVSGSDDSFKDEPSIYRFSWESSKKKDKELPKVPEKQEAQPSDQSESSEEKTPEIQDKIEVTHSPKTSVEEQKREEQREALKDLSVQATDFFDRLEEGEDVEDEDEEMQSDEEGEEEIEEDESTEDDSKKHSSLFRKLKVLKTPVKMISKKIFPSDSPPTPTSPLSKTVSDPIPTQVLSPSLACHLSDEEEPPAIPPKASSALPVIPSSDKLPSSSLPVLTSQEPEKVSLPSRANSSPLPIAQHDFSSNASSKEASPIPSKEHGASSIRLEETPPPVPLKNNSTLLESSSSKEASSIPSKEHGASSIRLEETPPSKATPSIPSKQAPPTVPSKETPPVPSKQTPPVVPSKETPSIPSKEAPPTVPSKATPSVPSRQTPSVPLKQAPPTVPSKETPSVPSKEAPPVVPSKTDSINSNQFSPLVPPKSPDPEEAPSPPPKPERQNN